MLYIWLEFSDVCMLEHYGGCHTWAGYAHPSGTPDITSSFFVGVHNVHFLVFCVLYPVLCLS